MVKEQFNLKTNTNTHSHTFKRSGEGGRAGIIALDLQGTVFKNSYWIMKKDSEFYTTAQNHVHETNTPHRCDRLKSVTDGIRHVSRHWKRRLFLRLTDPLDPEVSLKQHLSPGQRKRNANINGFLKEILSSSLIKGFAYYL